MTHYFCDTLFSHSPLRRVVSGESSVGREEGEKRELHSKPYKIVEFKEKVFVSKLFRPRLATNHRIFCWSYIVDIYSVDCQ